jgi:hypothetical protein
LNIKNYVIIKYNVKFIKIKMEFLMSIRVNVQPVADPHEILTDQGVAQFLSQFPSNDAIRIRLIGLAKERNFKFLEIFLDGMRAPLKNPPQSIPKIFRRFTGVIDMGCRGAILAAVITAPYESGQRTRLLELLLPTDKTCEGLIHPTTMYEAALEIVRKGRLDDLKIMIQSVNFHPSSIGEMLLRAVSCDKYEIAAELKRSGVITPEYVAEALEIASAAQNQKMCRLLKSSSVCLVQ